MVLEVIGKNGSALLRFLSLKRSVVSRSSLELLPTYADNDRMLG